MTEQLYLNCKINFNLRQPKIDNPSLIYAVISYQSRQYKISTNMKVVPNQWDYKQQFCTIGRGMTRLDYRNNIIANLRLKEILFAFAEFKLVLFNSDNVDIIEFKSLLNSIINPNKIRKEPISANCPTLVMAKLIDASEVKESTKKQYHNMVNSLKKWLVKSDIRDNWHNMNRDNLEAFRECLIVDCYSISAINMTIATIMRLLKGVDIVGNWSYNDTRISLITPLRGLLNKTEMSEEEIALSWDDIDAIYQFNDLTKRQIEVRDIFVLQCNCGQRISDMAKLINVELTNEMQTIVIRQQKTNEKAYIPITPLIREILARYKNGLKHIDLNTNHARGKINQEIKEICMKIERFNTLTTFKKQKGKNVISYDLPIYKRIHTHTARHSFITNWLRDGKDKNTLILISGHANMTMIDNVYQHLNDGDKCNMVMSSNGNNPQL